MCDKGRCAGGFIIDRQAVMSIRVRYLRKSLIHRSSRLTSTSTRSRDDVLRSQLHVIAERKALSAAFPMRGRKDRRKCFVRNRRERKHGSHDKPTSGSWDRADVQIYGATILRRRLACFGARRLESAATSDARPLSPKSTLKCEATCIRRLGHGDLRERWWPIGAATRRIHA